MLVKRKIQKYERLGIVSTDIILPLIESHSSIIVYGKKVKLNTLRMKVFKHKGLQCAYEKCHYVGSYFAVERDLKHLDDNLPYHLNLWGKTEVVGQDVLFTHDHILARSLGGENNMENCQPMCVWHNNYKSIEESKHNNLRYLKKRNKMEEYTIKYQQLPENYILAEKFKEIGL